MKSVRQRNDLKDVYGTRNGSREDGKEQKRENVFKKGNEKG